MRAHLESLVPGVGVKDPDARLRLTIESESKVDCAYFHEVFKAMVLGVKYPSFNTPLRLSPPWERHRDFLIMPSPRYDDVVRLKVGAEKALQIVDRHNAFFSTLAEAYRAVEEAGGLCECGHFAREHQGLDASCCNCRCNGFVAIK